MDTLLLKNAVSVGAKTVGGIEMLLGQGAKAFELFTHHEFPMQAARETLIHELTQGTRV